MSALAGTWLDFGNWLAARGRAMTDRSTFSQGGGRHWARTSDLLHVKQVLGVQGGSLNVAGTTDTPSRAASRLDIGWTRSQRYRLLEGMEE